MSIEKALRIWPQYILPHHFLSRFMHALTRIRGGAVTRAAMRAFAKAYDVNMQERRP